MKVRLREEILREQDLQLAPEVTRGFTGNVNPRQGWFFVVVKPNVVVQATMLKSDAQRTARLRGGRVIYGYITDKDAGKAVAG